MTRRTLVLSAVIATLLPAAALAHRAPARRSVSVQAEKDALVLLVTWTTPTGEDAGIWAAHAAAGRGLAGDRRAAMERALAAHALAPLSVTRGGSPVRFAEADAKLVEDPPGSGRLAVAVLLTAPVAPGDEVVVALEEDAERTRVRWNDRSGGAVAETWVSPEGDWLHASRPLTLRWNREKEQDP